MALILAPDLYAKAPLAPIPGARWDIRNYAIAAASLVNGNIIAMIPFPALCNAVAFFLETGALDTGNTMTLAVGILNSYYNHQVASATNVGGGYTDGGVTVPGLDAGVAPALVAGLNMLTASTIGRAGGRVFDSVLAYLQAQGTSNYHRIIAVGITAAVGNAVAGNITLGVEFDFGNV